MRANVPHTDNGSNHEVAPTLPPRNYHPEEVNTNHSSTPDSKPP